MGPKTAYINEPKTAYINDPTENIDNCCGNQDSAPALAAWN